MSWLSMCEVRRGTFEIEDAVAAEESVVMRTAKVVNIFDAAMEGDSLPMKSVDIRRLHAVVVQV